MRRTENLFVSPKPIGLIASDFLQIGTTASDDDIVLDFFAGSGTTVTPSLELNAADGGTDAISWFNFQNRSIQIATKVQRIL